MKILLEGQSAFNSVIDGNDGSLIVSDGGKVYLNMTGAPRRGVIIRGDYELVLKDGWICFDYDCDTGYVVGLEIHSGNPFDKSCSPRKPGYLQPKILRPNITPAPSLEV